MAQIVNRPITELLQVSTVFFNDFGRYLKYTFTDHQRNFWLVLTETLGYAEPG